MTLQEAINSIENLKKEATKKSETKIYEKFLHILTGLKARELSQDELQSIEAELNRLKPEPIIENRKKYYQQALSRFEKYLRDILSLTSKGYYTALGGGLGLSFGILVGVVFLSSFERSLGISMGLIIGMLVGLAIGRSMDGKAVSEGRVL